MIPRTADCYLPLRHCIRETKTHGRRNRIREMCVELQGLLRLPSQPADVAELMRRMTPPLTHRGPDGEGFDVASGIALGHRRLSIIDLDLLIANDRARRAISGLITSE